MAVAAAARAQDNRAWKENLDRITSLAGEAGYFEVIGAVERFESAVTGHDEDPAKANRRLTTFVYALPFRPSRDSIEGNLLEAWAQWDMNAWALADREEGTQLLAKLQVVAVAAEARDVLASLAALIQAARAGTESTMVPMLDEIAAAVYRRAYRRQPPPGAFPWARR